MKIEIEVYKNQTIYYDEGYDKFVCDISVEDNAKTAKRTSLVDLRSEIDIFIKINLNFKPFKAFLTNYDDFTTVTVEAIRKDGTFVINSGSNYKSYFTKDQCKKLRKFDHNIATKRSELFKKEEDFKKQHKADVKTLYDSLESINLDKYDLQ